MCLHVYVERSLIRTLYVTLVALILFEAHVNALHVELEMGVAVVFLEADVASQRVAPFVDQLDVGVEGEGTYGLESTAFSHLTSVEDGFGAAKEAVGQQVVLLQPVVDEAGAVGHQQVAHVALVPPVLVLLNQVPGELGPADDGLGARRTLEDGFDVSHLMLAGQHNNRGYPAQRPRRCWSAMEWRSTFLNSSSKKPLAPQGGLLTSRRRASPTLSAASSIVCGATFVAALEPLLRWL